MTCATWRRLFLVLGIIAAALGFSTIAGASPAIAKLMAGLFLILCVVCLVIPLTAASKIAE